MKRGIHMFVNVRSGLFSKSGKTLEETLSVQRAVAFSGLMDG